MSCREDLKGGQERSVLLTCNEAVNLGQRDALVVDITVFEKAPELQAGHQREVVWEIQKTEPAVEPVDGPQLCVVSPHHELHLLRRHIIREVCSWKGGPPREGGELWDKDKDMTLLRLQHFTCLRSASRSLSGMPASRPSMFRAMSARGRNT